MLTPLLSIIYAPKPVSIVKDDGFGRFKNELEIENTYDPTPYFGLPLNANLNPDTIPVCGAQR